MVNMSTTVSVAVLCLKFSNCWVQVMNLSIYLQDCYKLTPNENSNMQVTVIKILQNDLQIEQRTKSLAQGF